MSNIFEKLRGESPDLADTTVESVQPSPAAVSGDPSKRSYTREELLALHKPDYNVPSDFTFITGFTSPESLPPVAVDPDLYSHPEVRHPLPTIIYHY